MWYKVYILFNLYTLYQLLIAFAGHICPKNGNEAVRRLHNKWHNEKDKKQCKE